MITNYSPLLVTECEVLSFLELLLSTFAFTKLYLDDFLPAKTILQKENGGLVCPRQDDATIKMVTKSLFYSRSKDFNGIRRSVI
jgi:hypothetical protein